MDGRRHGEPPYATVVVHGGPGAPGSAFGVAAIAGRCIEPFQTRDTVQGQISELASVVESDATPPVILVGHSWGAMLSLMVAAARPDLVRKAVLVCSGGFTADSYARTNETRLARLTARDRERAEEISAIRRENKDEPLPELTQEYYNLISRADAFDPDPEIEDGPVEFQHDVNKKVWAEAVALRENGELLERIARVSCPVVAIHGDYDPHPVECVAEPLSRLLSDFRLVVIPNCGHEPWKKRQARDEFVSALGAELSE